MSATGATVASATRVAAILRPPRVPLLRRGHGVIALVVFQVHLLTRQASAWHVAVGLLFAAIWYAAVRSTILRESRATVSWASVVVRAGEAGLLAGSAMIALRSLLGLSDPLLGLVGVIAELTAFSFLWQAAVAGHRSLGEPLACVVIGPAEVVQQLESERLAPGARPFTLAGWIDEEATPTVDGQTTAPRLGSIDDLERIAYGGGIDLFVVGIRTGRPTLYARMLELTHLDVHVIEFPAFFEREFGRVPLRELTPTWFLHTMHLYRRDETQASKRISDLVLSAFLLILSAPVFIAGAIAVRLTSSGPVLFRQTRIGEHGRPFTMLKLRSMRHAPTGDSSTWTGGGDARITPVGAILRRFRIDELPQLVNVLRGEMTLVGPRPETPAYVRWLAEEIPFYKPRHFTKPGITGWAQVCAGYAASLDDTRVKLSYDLFYLRNRSVSLDLAILLRTVGTVLRGSGSR